MFKYIKNGNRTDVLLDGVLVAHIETKTRKGFVASRIVPPNFVKTEFATRSTRTQEERAAFAALCDVIEASAEYQALFV